MNAPPVVKRLFDWKVRGFRWIEIIGVVLVAVMVFSVYVAKAGAARESARIGELERQIADNRQRVRLLRAESTRLEQPGRLETLSRAAGLAPVDVERQAEAGSLNDLKPVETPTEVTPRAVYVAPVEDEPPALPDVGGTQ
jgi:hypothetical protein